MIKQAVLSGTLAKPSAVALAGWDSYIVTVSKKNKDLIGKILSDIAQEQNRDPFDLTAELVIDEPDMWLACGVMSKEDMEYAMKQDWLMFSSDGGASPIIQDTDEPAVGHPRAFSSQARVLRKYVREDEILTVENAVRKMTSLPADFLQMKGRGMLKKGYKADIAIFDPETIRDNATFDDARQYSTGTEYVIVNGKISIENGEYGNALNGKLLLLTENN
jgi:N-acyl-D-aspartate/D-glutamate deacylase